MSKNPSNGNIKVAWLPGSALTTPKHPDAAELNAGLDLSSAIAFENYEIAASDSADLDDRAITDLGNAVSRGAASYGATLDMFREKHNTDTTSTYQQAFEAYRTEKTLGYLVVRVNTPWTAAFAGGDVVSVYKLMATTVSDSTDGEGSTRFSVEFLPQGLLHVHTLVAGAGVITGIAPTKSAAVGDVYQLAPILAGKNIANHATYTSDDSAIARVSRGGVVKIVGTGTAEITVAHGSATSSVTQALTAA